MAELKTQYMGIELDNPIVAGASVLTSNMDTIKKLEDSGAAAIVIKTLFEEQVQYERFQFEDDLTTYDEWHAEMTNIFPEIEHAGPEEHLMWTRRAKEAVSIPVIASLNAVSQDAWVEYAKKLEETGVDGLELNFYSLLIDPEIAGSDVERQEIEAIQAVKDTVSIPISVKLSSYYTNPLHHIAELDRSGAKGFVLFNRLFHPDFDVEKEENIYAVNLSGANDHRLAVRFAGLLSDRINGSVCASNGIHTRDHLVRALLAGADCVQMVSAVLKNSPSVIGKVKQELSEWMDAKRYGTIQDFKGKLSYKNHPDTWTYKREKYIKILQSGKDLMKKMSIV